MPDQSEQILAQFLQQQQQSNRWNSPQNLINLATLGLSGISGFAGGAAAGRRGEQDEMDLEYRMAQDAYQRRLGARGGLQAAILDQMGRRDGAAAGIADRSPLGAEQLFRTQMARARGLSDVAGSFQSSRPLDPGIAALTPQLPNMVGAFASPEYRNAISHDATEQSIADRQRVLAAMNPDNQLGRENQLMQLLNAQMQEAAAPIVPAAGGGGQAYRDSQESRGGGGFWKTLGRIGLAAAPIIAAPFTGGASLAAIGAGAGAGSALLNGGGVRGALMGAGMGAAGSLFGGGAAGSAASRGVGEGVGSAIQRAVLNPRALASIGGSALPGTAGQVAGAASMFLPGARAYTGPMPGFQGPQMPALPSSGWEVDSNLLTPDMTAPVGPPQAPRPAAAPRPVSRPSSRPALPPMRPAVSHQVGAPPMTRMGTNRPAAMRAPTGIERARDFASPVFDFLNSIGAPGASQVSTTVPYANRPLAQGQPSAFGQVSQSPIGSAILGTTMGMAPRIPQMPAALPGRSPHLLGAGAIEGQVVNAAGPARQLAGVPAARSLSAAPSRLGLPAGQYNLPASSGTAGSTRLGPSPHESEIQHAPAIMRRLIAESQARLDAGDVAGARAIWNQMLQYQPFLPK